MRDTGTVYAVDINPAAIRYIESRIRKENLRNVKPILGRPDNPLLPGTVDAVLLLKTYHEVAQPIVLSVAQPSGIRSRLGQGGSD